MTKENIKKDIYETVKDNIIPQHLGKTIEENQLSYSDLVITNRAIPNLYDGLKPVNRRILTTFKHDNMINKNVKSAKIVGGTLSLFHPHGDLAVYGSLVEMVQVFKNRFPLIKGQGNWGNIQADSEGAQRYCVTGDTRITTSKGLVKIKDIVKSKENETIDIKENILSLDNKINSASKFFNSGYHDIYHLETRDGYEIKGSVNHPLLVFTKDSNGKPIYKWKMISNIEENEYVVLDRNNKTEIYSKIKQKSKDIEKAIILGCLVSKGSISSKRINFVNTDKDYYDDFIKAWEILYGKDYCSYTRILPSGKTIYEFDIKYLNKTKTIFKDKLFNSIKNKTVLEKKVPNFIFKSNIKIKKKFLQYLFEGDGSFVIKKDNSIMLSYSTSSKQLSDDLQILLLEFGVFTKRIEDKKGKSINYLITIPSIRNQNIFKNKISFSNFKKQNFEKIIELLFNNFQTKSNYSHSVDSIPFISKYIKSFKINSKIRKMNLDRKEKIEKKYKIIKKELKKTDETLFEYFDNIYKNNFYYSKVKSVKKLEKKEIVYSVKVDSDCHSFVANGFINHNTEARINSDMIDILFQNIDKDEVTTWKSNYDDTIKEPQILPTKYPIAFLNGTMGIAYAGITTKIPSYNIKDLTNFYIYMIENKFWLEDFNKEEHKENILKIIPSVDLPTGTNIYFDKDQKQEDMIFASEFGYRMRANYKINKKDRTITFTNIPMEVMTDRLVEEIKDAGLSYKEINKKKVPKKPQEILNIIENADVQSISSYGDKNYNNDAELILTFKKDVNLDVELIKVFKYTSLDSAYSAKLRFIDENTCPKLVSLFEQTKKFLEYRLHTFYKAYIYDIKKLKNQIHLLDGLRIIQNDLDTFVNIVKNNEDINLIDKIKENFPLDNIQIEYLLNIQLRKISKTSLQKIKDDINSKTIEKDRLEKLISTKEELYNEVKRDYQEQLTKQYMKGQKSERITKIISASKEISYSDLIENKEIIVMYMEDDTIGFLDKNKFRIKNRGSQTTSNKMNNDFNLNIKVSTNCELKDNLFLMTNKGRVFKVPGYEISSDFKYIGNILKLEQKENIISIIKVEQTNKFYSIVTKNGKIKGLHKDLLKNVTDNRGKITINLEDEDEVISFTPYNCIENEKTLMVTNEGKILKYSTEYIKVLNSGNTKGVKAVKLVEDEYLVSNTIFIETDKSVVLGVSDIGKAKKTQTLNISNKKRGQSPNIFFNNSKENGNLVGIQVITDENLEVIMAITKKANISIVKIKNFNNVSRTAKGGVNLINLKDKEKLKSIKKIKLIISEDDEELDETNII